jgi:hypothetical protein
MCSARHGLAGLGWDGMAYTGPSRKVIKKKYLFSFVALRYVLFLEQKCYAEDENVMLRVYDHPGDAKGV